MEYENNFRTKDFYLACFFHAKGIKLERALKEGTIIYFYFDNKQELKKLTQNYFNGTESVIAIEFVNAITNLKTLSYNI